MIHAARSTCTVRAAQSHVGCVHIADKHLKCLLVSHMRDGEAASTELGKHFHLL